MSEQRCISCNRVATYVAPEYFCDEHWLAWVNEGVPPEDHYDPSAGCPIASQRLNDHVDGCELCCTELNNFDYCPIGDSLMETWLDSCGFEDD